MNLRARGLGLICQFTHYREFPSLSGAPQPTQTQNPSQMVWANASQRAAQTPVQRQQGPPTTQPPSRTSQTPSNPPQQQGQQPSHDDLFPSGVQFANRLDDFRNGGQGISGQLGGGQPQTGSIDEFPPLGRNAAAEIGQGRRGSMMQNAGFGGYNAGIGFQGQSAQTRNMMAASVNGQETGRMMSPANMSPAGIAGSRSPVNQGPNGVLGQDKEVSLSYFLSFLLTVGTILVY